MREGKGSLSVVCLLIDTKLPRRREYLARRRMTLFRTNETLGNWHARCAIQVEVLALSRSPVVTAGTPTTGMTHLS